MYEQMENSVLDIHKDNFDPKTLSVVAKCLESPMSGMLSVIMLYK